MSDIDNRMCITMSELTALNDWIARLNSDVTLVELRRGMEPGIGPALTAYVELHDDEGYFKLLTNAYTVNLNQVETALKAVINNDKALKPVTVTTKAG